MDLIPFEQRGALIAPTGKKWKDAEIGRFIQWCEDAGRAHDRDALRAYIEALADLAPNTIKTKLSALKSGYEQSCKDANLPAHWLDQVFRELRKTIPTIQNEPPKVISREEYGRMLKELPEEYQRVLVRALWETGARVSELCCCRLKSCVRRKEYVEASVVGKGKKIRALIMSHELYKAIREAYPIQGNFLFHGLKLRNGKLGHLNRASAFRWVRNAGSKIGLECNCLKLWQRTDGNDDDIRRIHSRD